MDENEFRGGVSAMEKMSVDYLDNAARVFGRQKAQEVAGLIVDAVLSRTEAHIPSLGRIQNAEEYICRFVAALIKNSVVEFTKVWAAEQEFRTDAAMKLAAEALNTRLSPPIIVERKP